MTDQQTDSGTDGRIDPMHGHFLEKGAQNLNDLPFHTQICTNL